MPPEEFLRTVYLGDRACKKLILDGWEQKIAIEVDVISRVRSLSGQWEYYTQEDIPDGLIVFSGVRNYQIATLGHLPNDYIEIEVESISETPTDGLCLFKVYLGYMGATGVTDIELQIEARSIHLEDPRLPGKKILN